MAHGCTDFVVIGEACICVWLQCLIGLQVRSVDSYSIPVHVYYSEVSPTEDNGEYQSSK